MKHSSYFIILVSLVLLFPGCKKQESDTDGIRSGINQHLASLKTLNLGAMDMNVTNVSIQGNQAHAQVEFTPKGGAGEGAGMQVAYSLEKKDGQWVVQSSQPTGGSLQHPSSTGDAPIDSTSESPDSLPNFRDLVPGAANSNALPPGHPSIQDQQPAQPQ
jgi:hypothetical protein